MSCPRCQGYVTPPLWEYSKQGKCLTVKCVNCGWYGYHPTQFVPYSVPETRIKVARPIPRTRKQIRSEVPLRGKLRLVDYEFEP